MRGKAFMIFIKIPKTGNIKKVLDYRYMLLFFEKRKNFFLNKKEELKDIKIDLVRNFRGKFRNMTLKYTLFTDFGEKIIRARTHKFQDSPRRDGNVLKFLNKNRLGDNIPLFIYYYQPLNILFYLETPGISSETLLSQKKIKPLLKIISLAAIFLKKIHHLKKGLSFLPIKDIKQEKKERRHWFFLVRKCAPEIYSEFYFLLKELWDLRKKHEEFFLTPSNFSLVHSDFHWGNIVCHQDNFFFIDFCYAFRGDPLEDVGGFLAQNDSMFRYYAPYSSDGIKIRKKFLRSYFGGHINKNQQYRLLYFEAQKILEMAAVLSFVETNEEYKKRGMATLLSEARKKILELKSK
jgi:thiamine kinase-like enzyme